MFLRKEIEKITKLKSSFRAKEGELLIENAVQQHLHHRAPGLDCRGTPDSQRRCYS
jgi:hypothetical protein